MLITPQGPRYASAAEIETDIRVVVAGREILNIRAGGQSVAKDQASILRDAAFVLVTTLYLDPPRI